MLDSRFVTRLIGAVVIAVVVVVVKMAVYGGFG